MSIDLSNLPPAPWFVGSLPYHVKALCDKEGEPPVGESEAFRLANTWSGHAAPRMEIAKTVAAFAVLARNAFDIMLRRGWGVERVWNNDLRVYRWYIVADAPRALREGFADPFTALVEADRWYAENVEGARGAAT